MDSNESDGMIKANPLPQIDEAIGLLYRHSPAILEQFTRTHPDYKDLFTPGITAGAKEAKGIDELRIRAEAALASANQAKAVCAALIPKFQERIRKSSQLELSAQILSVVSGASIVAALRADFPVFMKYSLATVNLISSAIALFSKYFGGSAHNGRHTAIDDYRELVECRIDAEQIAGELELWHKKNFIGIEKGVIQRANRVAYRINKVESRAYWIRTA